MRSRLAIAALAIPLALLSACGDDEADATDPGASPSSPSEPASETPADTPSEPAETSDPSADWPACKSVWKDGARLPGRYAGCREGGEGVKADKTSCSFVRPIVTYADRFYAVPTGVIHETAGRLEKDRGYRSAMASCRA